MFWRNAVLNHRYAPLVALVALLLVLAFAAFVVWHEDAAGLAGIVRALAEVVRAWRAA